MEQEKVRRALSPCSMRGGQGCSCVGGAGLHTIFVLYKTALVIAELSAECTSHAKRRARDIRAYYEYILPSLVGRQSRRHKVIGSDTNGTKLSRHMANSTQRNAEQGW